MDIMECEFTTQFSLKREKQLNVFVDQFFKKNYWEMRCKNVYYLRVWEVVYGSTWRREDLDYTTKIR